MLLFWHSGECSRTFWGMLVKIPGNVQEDSEECSKRLCCFSSTFFPSHYFLFSRKGCNYCAQVQGCQKTLNNPQLRGLKNTLCILPRLKSRSVRGASHHPVFMGSRPTISHKRPSPQRSWFDPGRAEYLAFNIVKFFIKDQRWERWKA